MHNTNISQYNELFQMILTYLMIPDSSTNHTTITITILGHFTMNNSFFSHFSQALAVFAVLAVSLAHASGYGSGGQGSFGKNSFSKHDGEGW